MKATFLSVIIFVAGSTATAYTLDCSSADSKIQYQIRQSDGGAAMRRSVLLRVDGEDVINIPSFGENEVVRGQIQLAAKKTQLKVKKTKDYKTNYFNIDATVTDLNSNVLAGEMVHCKEVIYIGPPRP